jgi:hypothetical protein
MICDLVVAQNDCGSRGVVKGWSSPNDGFKFCRNPPSSPRVMGIGVGAPTGSRLFSHGGVRRQGDATLTVRGLDWILAKTGECSHTDV